MRSEPGKKLYQCPTCKALYTHDEARNHPCNKQRTEKK